MRQNINRVDHVVWLSQLQNQDANVRKLSELCNLDFGESYSNHHLGVRIYLSWEAGLEIIAPLGQEAPFAIQLHDHLARRGEGFFAVIFGVDDIVKARERTAALNYQVGDVLQLVGDEPFARKTEVMKEIFVGEFMRTVMIFGEIVYRQ